jgi:hypothetical protein
MRGLNMMFHGHWTEFTWGLNMLWGLPVIAQGLLIAAKAANHTPSANDTQNPIHIEQVAAATVAYGYYIAAAMMVGAQFPSFFRDHLFDGFAPAVLVGFLIYRIRNAQAGVSNAAVLYLQSAVVFGLIAAAAIFTSGKDNFLLALYAALIGGFIFPLVILAARLITEDAARDVAPEVHAETDSGPGQPAAGASTQPAPAAAPAAQDRH